MERFALDPGLREEIRARVLGEGAQAYCEERYSRESVLSEWERLLKRVAGE